MERKRRCDRNRKRSKRRAIYCPEHGCYLDSASKKYRLYAESAQDLTDRGVGRRTALLLFATATTVSLDGEWLECFWCDQCQETTWYHVIKTGEREYTISLAPRDLWQQAAGVITVNGNPTVSEFTRRQARATNFRGIKDFNIIR
jgi:hypothetical protein